MKSYLIRYVDGDGTNLRYRCSADTYEHAVEQLQDHEDSLTGKVLSHELIKNDCAIIPQDQRISSITSIPQPSGGVMGLPIVPS